jgi:hypothetical protein
MAQIIGSVLVESVAAIKARHGDQGLEKIIKHLNGEAKLIFSSPIEAWKWYPLDAFVSFLDADIRETANGDRRILVGRSMKVVELQLRGDDSMIAGMDSPKYVINRIAVIHTAQFQGIQIIPEIDDGPRATIKYMGFEKHHDIFEWVLVGFYVKALEICGAKDVSAKFTIPISEGAAYSEIALSWA